MQEQEKFGKSKVIGWVNPNSMSISSLPENPRVVATNIKRKSQDPFYERDVVVIRVYFGKKDYEQICQRAILAKKREPNAKPFSQNKKGKLTPNTSGIGIYLKETEKMRSKYEIYMAKLKAEKQMIIERQKEELKELDG